MALPSAPHTWVANDDATSGNLQTLTDNINYLRAVPVCSVYRSGVLVVPTGSTVTNLTWDGEFFDNDAVHSVATNTHRLTVVTPGKYLVVVGTRWQASSVNQNFTDVTANANVGGSVYEIGRDIRPWVVSATTPGSSEAFATRVVDMAAGDYFYAQVLHGGSGNLNIAGGSATGTFMSLFWVAV